jgi:quinone-modifying oxidoreductase, subunit QmoC
MGPKRNAPDFGWRLHGRVVTVLADRSSDLGAVSPSGAFLEPYCRDVHTLQSCLQCGACTATCGLAEEDSLFPRREVTFVQLGLEDRLAVDPSIWHCYGCDDCSTRCPSGAKPGRIMGALRHLGTERFAFPRTFSRLANSPRLFWLAYVVAVLVLAATIAAAGAFAPGAGPVRYADMLPHGPLDLLFFAVLSLALASMGVGLVRAWRGWHGDALGTPRARPLLCALGRAVLEVIGHRKFSDCDGRRPAGYAHRAVFFGFLGLLAVSGIVALLLLAGGAYPLPALHPLKLLANVLAVLLVAGASFQLAGRIADAARGEASPFFDWIFLANLLLVGLTGIAVEALRYLDIGAAAYPAYFAHLALVLVLLATLPYSKLAHAGYRVLAVAGRHYLAGIGEPLQAPPVAAQARRSVVPPRPAQEASVAAPEAFLGLRHQALAAYPDATLAAAYYKLRDESVPHGDGRSYPNIRRLFGTALEREKDRREVRFLVGQPDKPEIQAWYEDAARQPCTWWLKNHLVARHSLKSCMFCGMCTSMCPAAQYYEEYNPRFIVDVALADDEERLKDLLGSDLLWFCGQCGSCKARCTRENNIMGLVSSLRSLAQLKGYHLRSARGRQQYAARHLWGANFWNRACSLYFRNPDPAAHPDFGPRHARGFAELDLRHERLGAHPDMDGVFGGRKVPPATLKELRQCVRAGGTLFLWNRIEEHAAGHAAGLGIDIDDYLRKVRSEG